MSKILHFYLCFNHNMNNFLTIVIEVYQLNARYITHNIYGNSFRN